jgi:hypothetical protein
MTEQDRKAIDMSRQISDYLNCYGQSRANELVENLLLEHRTLQQSFTRLCMRWFERLAQDSHGHDLRNEASVELAKKIMALPARDRALPLI